MSQPSDLLLTVDIQNRRIVSFNGSPSALPTLYQSNTVSLKVICVNPGQTSFPQANFQQYVQQNMAGFGMRAAVGPAPMGTVGPSVIALQPAMAWDATNQWFAGDLALNTTDVDNYIGSASSKPAYFELNLTINGVRITILQTTFTLTAVLDELLSLVPTPVDTFRTAAESDAKYAWQKGAPGQTQIVVSPNGQWGIECGCDNNGQFFTKSIQNP